MPKRTGKELLEYLYSGEIVEEHKFGGTRVRIWDTAYRDATPEEIQRRKTRINDAALNCVRSWSNEERAAWTEKLQ